MEEQYRAVQPDRAGRLRRLTAEAHRQLAELRDGGLCTRSNAGFGLQSGLVKYRVLLPCHTPSIVGWSHRVAAPADPGVLQDPSSEPKDYLLYNGYGASGGVTAARVRELWTAE